MLQIMVAAWITIEVERSREGRVDWHVVEGLRREHGVELVVRPRLWLVIESFISIRLYSSALMAVVIDMIVLVAMVWHGRVTKPSQWRIRVRRLCLRTVI